MAEKLPIATSQLNMGDINYRKWYVESIAPHISLESPMYVDENGCIGVSAGCVTEGPNEGRICGLQLIKALHGRHRQSHAITDCGNCFSA